MTEPDVDSKNDSDALKRLINKSRPVVESRNSSLSSLSSETSNTISSDTRVSGMPDNLVSTVLGNEKEGSTEAHSKDIATKQLETKQSTLRLETGVSERLQVMCRQEGICREVLLEAMFEYCETSPEALRIVVEAAKQKNDYRQEIANRRRAKSMMDKFG